MDSEITNLLPTYQSEYTQYLISLIPQTLTDCQAPCRSNVSAQEYLLKALELLANETSLQTCSEMDFFCKQLGIDRKKMIKMDNYISRFDYILKAMDKSIQEQVRKVKNNVKNYVSCKNQQKSIINAHQKKDNFSWLNLKSKYPKLEPKLKSKIIQTINEQKNQKVIRNHLLMKGKSGYKEEKVQLQEDSLFMDQYQKGKIDYQWNQNDENILLNNINKIKQKCKNNCQFLKLCRRFKFISQKQFQTLAAEQISRRLDKNNKVFLSRQFLLDKYFSSTQILNEQQIRFILKTSPMLSKCVDRSFIKLAIKNIQYQDISKIQLKIAQDIIGRFQQIRNSVRQSRKFFKQAQNAQTKQRIINFQKTMESKIVRQLARQRLANHKVSLLRSINYQNKAPAQLQNLQKLTSPKNKSCKPLNKFHPTSGLFVKDCNQQCNDDLYNIYEANYISTLNKPNKYLKTPKKTQMIQFYTGGPDDNILTTFNQTQEDVENICKLLKSHYFQKCLSGALQSIDQQRLGLNNQANQISTKARITCVDIKTKKFLAAEEENQSELKKRVIQNKQKAKSTVYVNKLLILSAQNSFLNLKALNPKFSPEEVNSKDKRGNTALFYGCKHQNIDLIQFLLKFGADPNIYCQKNNTPLHLAFKSNNLSVILKVLTAQPGPNLNCLNLQLKTPLAYCSREILKKLGLDQGIVSVNNCQNYFNNNLLLQRQAIDKVKQDCLQFNIQLGVNNLIKQNKGKLTSIQNI